MKSRQVTLPSGQNLHVPQGIQRIDSSSTHGWQVRHQGTKFFSDGQHGSPKESLICAMHELLARIKSTPMQSSLKKSPSANKTTDLPPGISGPIVRVRTGRPPLAELSVLLPRFGQRAAVKNIYIGSQNTYTPEKYLAALERGIEMRKQATELYTHAAMKAHNASITQLRAHIESMQESRV